ncbi:MAG TPA: oligopeptide/dipeptide ABC transporter ATP-binding protein, partial [Phytomonospora sp.]
PTKRVLGRPRHPYTKALLASVPAVRQASVPADPLPGAPANPMARPSGCAFHPRCPLARERCRTEVPLAREIEPGRWGACHFAEEVTP